MISGVKIKSRIPSSSFLEFSLFLLSQDGANDNVTLRVLMLMNMMMMMLLWLMMMKMMTKIPSEMEVAPPP